MLHFLHCIACLTIYLNASVLNKQDTVILTICPCNKLSAPLAVGLNNSPNTEKSCTFSPLHTTGPITFQPTLFLCWTSIRGRPVLQALKAGGTQWLTCFPDSEFSDLEIQQCSHDKWLIFWHGCGKNSPFLVKISDPTEEGWEEEDQRQECLSDHGEKM